MRDVELRCHNGHLPANGKVTQTDGDDGRFVTK
jgi:hypothetical protein